MSEQDELESHNAALAEQADWEDRLHEAKKKRPPVIQDEDIAFDCPAWRLAKSSPSKRRRRTADASKAKWNCRSSEFRNRYGLSQNVVAGAIGMSKTGLWQIEHGSDPMLSTAVKLAKFFGVRVEELFLDVKP